MEEAVDLASWSVIRLEAGGREGDKAWVSRSPDDPREDHWLWKPCHRTAGGQVYAISDVAEVCASRLAARLGLPAADCRFAVRDGVRGVISRNVTPEGFDLHVGTVFLSEVRGYEHRAPSGRSGAGGGRVRADVGYTLDAVEQVLEGVQPPPQAEGAPSDSLPMTAFQTFSGYLLLDALVANTDRHPGNWALLERREDGVRFLAPSFDHGSALGSGMGDDKRTRRSPAAFCRSGRAKPFTPPQSLVDLAHAAAWRSGDGVWIPRLASLTEADLLASLQAPAGRLSEVAATFIEQVLIINRGRVCDVDGCED